MTPLECPNCNEDVSQIEIVCSNCNFPLAGTEKEKSIFIGKQIANKAKIGDAKESQQKAQRILYFIGAFQLYHAFIAYRRFGSIEDVVFYIILGVLLAVFGYFSSKKPILFLSIALAIILCYYLLLFLINPELVFRGGVWKVVIIGFLGYGIWHALEAQKLKKENNFLKKE